MKQALRLISLYVTFFAISPAVASSILGAAQPFAVLGASTVTNAGASSVSGEIGVAPGTSITGQSGIAGASVQSTTVSQSAQDAAASAYNALSAMPATVVLSGKDLGTVGVLTPGVYSFATSAALTGSLELDFTTQPSGAFVFEIGTTLTLESLATISSVGGNSQSQIYFLVGSSATLGTGSSLEGNILAQQSVVLNTGAAITCGRAVALIGAVTLDSNAISDNCTNGTDFGSDGFSGGVAATSPTDVPEPDALFLFSVGLTGLLTLRLSRSGRSEIRRPIE